MSQREKVERCVDVNHNANALLYRVVVYALARYQCLCAQRGYLRDFWLMREFSPNLVCF